MRKTLKMLTLCLLVGLGFTALSLAVTGDYCCAGPGYGFPSSIIHPSHGDSRLAHVFRHEKWSFAMEVDFESLLINLGFWTLIAPLMVCAAETVRDRRGA